MFVLHAEMENLPAGNQSVSGLRKWQTDKKKTVVTSICGTARFTSLA
jgi:hypothetical protein